MDIPSEFDSFDEEDNNSSELFSDEVFEDDLDLNEDLDNLPI